MVPQVPQVNKTILRSTQNEVIIQPQTCPDIKLLWRAMPKITHWWLAQNFVHIIHVNHVVEGIYDHFSVFDLNRAWSFSWLARITKCLVKILVVDTALEHLLLLFRWVCWGGLRLQLPYIKEANLVSVRLNHIKQVLLQESHTRHLRETGVMLSDLELCLSEGKLTNFLLKPLFCIIEEYTTISPSSRYNWVVLSFSNAFYRPCMILNLWYNLLSFNIHNLAHSICPSCNNLRVLLMPK